MRKISIIFLFLVLGALCAEAQHYDRGYEVNPSSPFLKKGAWMLGGSARYTQHANENFNLLVIDNINSTGFNLSASPRFLYVVKDNQGIGLKFSYNRGMLDLSTADLSVSDISMSVQDCYQIHHKYTAYAFYRAYIPIAGAKRIALIADIMLGGSYKQGKAFYPVRDYIKGTYEEKYSAELAVDPGLIAFLSERLALEFNVGLFGVSYGWSQQVHNQVGNGNSDSASAGFMVNILSLAVGISYYFL